MKRIFKIGLTALTATVACLITSVDDAKALTFESELQTINGIDSTVDFWSFTTNSSGSATFDILSWQAYESFFDSMLWVFRDDGNLDVADLITQNDDSSSTFADGSQSALDSYLSVFLNPGNYLLAVGQCCDYGGTDIIDGIQSWGRFYSGSSTTGFIESGEGRGSYQITFGGTVASANLQGAEAIPTPALLPGLIGMGVAAFRKKGKEEEVVGQEA